MKKKESKQKKMDVRVDFTPMVDMMMLLITFFMLCTSLAKPQTMELSMPSNDKNLTDENKSVTKESYTITIYVTGIRRSFMFEKDHLGKRWNPKSTHYTRYRRRNSTRPAGNVSKS